MLGGAALADRACYALCALAVLTGAALAVSGALAGYPYWIDEGYSVVAVLRPLGEALRFYILPDVHPPLYYLLLHLWVQLFGSGEVAARSLSLLGALAALGLLWGMGRGRYSALGLWVAAAWLCVHWMWVMSAQDARMYALMLAGSMWLCLAFVPLWTAGGPTARRPVAVFALGAVLLAGLHYYAMLLSCVALVLVSFRCRRDLAALAAPLAAAGACVAWLAFNALHMQLPYSESRTPAWALWHVVTHALGLGFPQLHWLLVRDAAVPAPYKAVALLGMASLGAYAWRRVLAPGRGAPAKPSGPGGELRDTRGEELRAFWGLGALAASFLLALACIHALKSHPLMKGLVVLLPPSALMLGIALRQARIGIWRPAVLAALLGSSLWVVGQWRDGGRNNLYWYRLPPMDRQGLAMVRDLQAGTAGPAPLYLVHYAWRHPSLWLQVRSFYVGDKPRPLVRTRPEDERHIVPPYYVWRSRARLGRGLYGSRPAEERWRQRGLQSRRLSVSPPETRMALFYIESVGNGQSQPGRPHRMGGADP